MVSTSMVLLFYFDIGTLYLNLLGKVDVKILHNCGLNHSFVQVAGLEACHELTLRYFEIPRESQPQCRPLLATTELVYTSLFKKTSLK